MQNALGEHTTNKWKWKNTGSLDGAHRFLRKRVAVLCEGVWVRGCMRKCVAGCWLARSHACMQINTFGPLQDQIERLPTQLNTFSKF